MPENLSRYTKLLVVSDTGMYQHQEETYAFEPVVKELQVMLSLFESITWIGFNREDHINNSSYTKIEDKNIKTILLKNVGGKTYKDKLAIILSYPMMREIINSEIKKHNYMHCRAPSNPAYITMLLSKKYPNKQFWFKYAGDWIGEASFFYKFQRNKLKKLKGNCKITVNGEWKDHAKNIITFENPCLNEDERIEGKQLVLEKRLEKKIEYCFVGGLNHNKGIEKIVDAFKDIDANKIGTLHIVGDGILRNKLEEKSKQLEFNVVFYGSLPKRKVVEVYKQSHFIILPSLSEGFPKVIGEAMNFGCVPIVSDVSCIGQYVVEGINGFLIKPVEVKEVKNSINRSLTLNDKRFKNFILENFKMANKFTYNYYINQIEENILIDTLK